MPDAQTSDVQTMPQNDDTGHSRRDDSVAQPLVEQAKQQAHKVVEQTQQKAGEAMGYARDKTKSWIEQQKDAVADSLDHMSQAVRQTGEQLEQQGPQEFGKVGEFARGGADAVGKVSGYLRTTNVDEVVGEVERFAKRQPALFVAVTAAVGFLAVRFLRSSTASGTSGSYGYDPDRRLPVVIDAQTASTGKNYLTPGSTG